MDPDYAFKAGDTAPLRASFPTDLRTAVSAVLHVRPITGGDVQQASVEIEDTLRGRVRGDHAALALDPGLYYLEWSFTYEDGSTETFPRREYDVLAVTPDTE